MNFKRLAPLVVTFYLLLSATTSLPGEEATARADDAAAYPFITDSEGVLFNVAADRKILRCVGRFANTDGNFDGPFTPPIRVRFGAAAAGRVNRCVITVTLQGAAGQPPETRTNVFRVVVPKLVSRTLAHVPGTTDDRTTVGMGEEIMMTVEPRHALVDADVTWRINNSRDILSNRRGLAMIFAAIPPPSAGRRASANDGSLESQPTAFFRVATNEVTLTLGHGTAGAESGRAADKSSARLFNRFVRAHTPAALDAAYRSKLGRTESQARGWSFEPVPAAPSDDSPGPRFYLTSPGTYQALRTLATLHTRAAGDGTAEQPADLHTREIRLVAGIVAVSRRKFDPAFDPEQPPQYWDAKPPPGYRLKQETIIISGRIDPEDIVQPDLRRQYRRTIAANNARMSRYNKQRRAQDDADTVRRFALTYVRALCAHTDPHLHEFRATLLALGLDERAVKEIVRKPRD